MVNESLKILLFEDNPGDARIFQEYLREGNLADSALEIVSRLSTGLEYLSQNRPDCILLDLGLPDSNGMETFIQVHAQASDVPIIVLTGLNDSEQAVQTVKDGAQDYLVKDSVNAFILQRAITYAIERHQLISAQQSSELQLRNIIRQNSDGIIVVKKDGIVWFANPAAEAIFCGEDQKLVGQPFGSPFVTKEKTELDIFNRDKGNISVEMSVQDVQWEGESAYLVSLHDITERKKNEQETLLRLNQLEALYSSSLDLNHTLQPQEIGETLIKLLSDRFQWHHVTVRLYNPSLKTFELLAFHLEGLDSEEKRLEIEERFKSMVSRPGEGLAGWAFEQNRITYSADVTKDPRYKEVVSGIQSGLYIPMKASGKPIGVLSVESEQINAFTETDEWLLTTLASQAANSLENARMVNGLQNSLQRMASLHAIDKAISSTVSLDRMLEILLEQTITQLSIDAANILIYDTSTQHLQFAKGFGFRTQALQHTNLRLGEGYAGMAAQEKRTIHIQNLQTDNTNFLRSPTFNQESFVCYYAVPLIAKDEIRGVLEIFHRSTLYIDTGWLDFMDTLAGQAAIAIDNATLYTDMQHSNRELNKAYEKTIEGWSWALDLRDEETEGHSQRVSQMTVGLARAMGIDENEIKQIRYGSLLHDIGKMGVPDQILHKPDKLTAEEWDIMRKHPLFAYELLAPIEYLHDALDIPYAHHEKWDGTGYPRGLKGEEIPIQARIFAIIDVYDALTSDRPYRKAWTQDKALAYITEEAGSHFDPEVVDVFIQEIKRLLGSTADDGPDSNTT